MVRVGGSTPCEISDAARPSPDPAPGTVWLVGLDPAAPGLVPMAALGNADFIVVDGDVDARGLPATCIAEPVPEGPEEAAVRRCMALAYFGWRVVRLLSGDCAGAMAMVREAAVLEGAAIPYRIMVVGGIGGDERPPPFRQAPAHPLGFSMAGVAG
jgi:hypothetical protein